MTPMTPSMTRFGTLPDGRRVDAVTLSAGDLSVRLLNLGAIVQDVRLAGIGHGLTLGASDPADYAGALNYFGALVGPVVNRLTGAQAPIAGRPHRFEANQDGRHILHSASCGTWGKIWEVVDHGADHVTFALTLPDGDGGFPGNRQVTARFSVAPPATLRMEVTGTTDAPTLMNFANHSYWNLDGGATWAGHSLRIAADHYLPVTEDTVPTGEIRSVAGTKFDFREARKIAPGAPGTAPLDHNFCLSRGREALRDVLWLGGASGLSMVLATTEPGVQVYDGAFTRGPGGNLHEGLAIEAQGWPDAPNHAAFPAIDLAPGDRYAQVTEWRFG